MKELGKFLALDIGDRRIGVATNDALGITVRALPAIDRRAIAAESEIGNLVQTLRPRAIVVGLPLAANGDETDQSEKVRNFCRRLQKRIGIEIQFVDERNTSADARQRLGLGESPSRAVRSQGVVDSLAAVIILESYLARIAHE